MNELLELKGITAGYEHTVVLRDVNLSIREHDFIGIIGPNGGGKTTLLKVILGLLKPFSGEIVYHVSKQSLFGYLPQNSRFDARFPISVKEVVLSGLMSEKGIFKDYTKADREKVDELLETYGRIRESSDRRAFRGTDATGVLVSGYYFFPEDSDFG